MSEFMDRARAEAEHKVAKRNRAAFENEGEYLSHTWGQGFKRGFTEGAAWAVEQEPTDEEVEAAAYEIYRRAYRMTWVSWDRLRPYVKTPFRSAGRAALLAAQKVRAGQ